MLKIKAGILIFEMKLLVFKVSGDLLVLDSCRAL